MKKLNTLREKFLAAGTRSHLLLFVLIGTGLVSGAFIIEYGFKAAPCHLCWLQRYGHWALLAIAFVGAFLPPRGKILALKGVFLAALYGFILGVYHSLVQAKVIPGPSSCSGASALPTDIESFSRYLENPTLPPRCDEVGFAFLGVSLPVWNIIAMALVMLVVYDVFKHIKKNQVNKL